MTSVYLKIIRFDGFSGVFVIVEHIDETRVLGVYSTSYQAGSLNNTLFLRLLNRS